MENNVTIQLKANWKIITPVSEETTETEDFNLMLLEAMKGIIVNQGGEAMERKISKLKTTLGEDFQQVCLQSFQTNQD